MCFLFHKWSAWSDKYDEIWVTASGVRYTKVLQKRTCSVCNMIELRKVWS